MFQSEAAIDYACDQDRVCDSTFPRWPGVTGRLCCRRNLMRYSSRGNWDQMRRWTTKQRQHERCQNGKSGSSSDNTVTWDIHSPQKLARALRHTGARREAIRFVLKELRCPTCEARPLPLPPRPGMLPRCLRFNQCIGVDLVDLEVRDGTSAKAFKGVCWCTGLQILQELWNGYTANAVMSKFKVAWVKHYGCPEILVHDQGPSSWEVNSKTLRRKTARAGQCFKQQLWDTKEECHIEGKLELEASIAECCDARNRYSNRSGFSAHHRVFGSSLRLPGSLLSDNPIDRQLLTADPYTDFQGTNDMRTAAQRALFKQNFARAVQAAGLARHRSQPREDINAADTAMVQQGNWKERLDWTRCRCCSVTDATLCLDIHAWVSAEVFERTSAQGERCGMARCRVG